jgi:hypothetical protein
MKLPRHIRIEVRHLDRGYVYRVYHLTGGFGDKVEELAFTSIGELEEYMADTLQDHVELHIQRNQR